MRDLVVLADGQDVRDLLPPDDDRARLIHLTDCLPIGQKRNFGCEQAPGDLICHWDDDDWSAPGRIEEQVHRFLSSGREVIGYQSLRFTDGTDWWQYRGESSYALGTSLLYTKQWWSDHPFRAVQVGEDNQFVREAFEAGQLDTVDAGELMYATIHNGNTSPRSLGNNWSKL